MPFFGVPIRNGLPIGLGSVAGFGAPQEFTPAELFIGGTAGTWYDPSDLTTMFTTSAGTTPVAMPGLGAAVSVGRMLDKSGNGNHAIAINDSTARPELRARVNLLEYSEQFDNAYWSKNNNATSNPVVTANQGIAPDGTNTADRIDFPAIVNAADASQVFATLTLAAASYTGTLYLKAFAAGDVGKKIWLQLYDTATRDLQSITLTSDWQKIQSASPLTAGASRFFAFGVYGTGSGGSAQGAVSVLAWGADLRPANIGAAVPAYQRIADANTYDTAGFPLYLRFDGIDDGMYTPANLNLTATDKVGVFAGVRKLSDAAFGMLTELSALANNNNGTFAIGAPGWSPVASQYGTALRATVNLQYANSPAAFSAPITNILTDQFTTTGATQADRNSLRINGVTQTLTFLDNTTASGNFGTYPLFIGSRNNSSVYFNGHLHGLIVVGSAVSAGNISATESWMAGKTGIVI